MEKGLKYLQTAARTASGRVAPVYIYDDSDSDETSKRFQSYQDDDDRFSDSSISFD